MRDNNIINNNDNVVGTDVKTKSSDNAKVVEIEEAVKNYFYVYEDPQECDSVQENKEINNATQTGDLKLLDAPELNVNENRKTSETRKVCLKRDKSESECESEIDHDNEVIKKKKRSKFERKRRFKAFVSSIILTISWIISLCLLYLCLSNLYQQMFNYNNHTGFFGIGEAIVASNSMEPKLCPDDLIFYKTVDIDDITIGDTIVYQKTDSDGNNILVVHDVIQIGDGYVTTQGINNAAPDEAFSVSAVVGRYIFKIDKVGMILKLFSNKWATIVVISAIFVMFAMRMVIYYTHKKKIIASISNDINTRNALNYFFDI